MNNTNNNMAELYKVVKLKRTQQEVQQGTGTL